MLNSHVKFHALGGKRRVLVADDEPINRELLGNLLGADYEVLYAADGRETLEIMRKHSETLSLVLLDILMPVMSGMEVLRAVRGEPALERIPIIVVTSDQSAEIESLGLGACDFISKPYPQPGVVLARVLRTIELYEDREIIQSTERDPLTGLYNKEFFYRYAEQFDQRHRDMAMDAVVLDVNHFHIINERYGKAFGDKVLRRVGEELRGAVGADGGIVCRREADTFMIYCPHRADYRELLERAAVALESGDGAGNRVRLRMGVYGEADKSIDIERRFDRAKSASDTVRNSYSRTIALYDDALHKAELYEEQLIDDFHEAIRDGQFLVYYQPKFDVRPEIPVLQSAEALARWKHPRLGVISPGVFIPLFEANGLIQQLDSYVWRRAAAQIRAWKDRFGISVPVSVNVSRIDMYDPRLVEHFQSLLSAYGLTPDELLLEITESAYTDDSARIIDTVNRLRGLGFRIEMDDFGTGYSSLNMISSLPIDALKLDMAFIRNAFRDGGDTRMIEVIIDIADYLSVPVIAEGVETEEQLRALKAMGCDIVQGYYFSRPVSPEAYETYIEARKRAVFAPPVAMPPVRADSDRDATYAQIAHALTSGFERIYYIDTLTGHFVTFNARASRADLQIERSGDDFFGDIQPLVQRHVAPEDRERVALSLQREALLTQLLGGNSFTMTYRLDVGGRIVYHNLRAVNARLGKEHHIVIGVSDVEEQMRQAMGSERLQRREREFLSLARALSGSDECVYYVDTDTDAYLQYVTQGAPEALDLKGDGNGFFEALKRRTEAAAAPEDREKLAKALARATVLERLEARGEYAVEGRLLLDGEPTCCRVRFVPVEGERGHIVAELKNVAAELRREQELHEAREKANRDALTGVKSKHAYVGMEAELNGRIAAGAAEPFAVAVCDVNGLKEVNDSQGHQAGDQLIRTVSSVICNVFKHSPVYRTGGDEFVVLLRGADYERRERLRLEMAGHNREATERGGAIIAVGMADFRPGEDASLGEVFDRADAIMYEDKKRLKALM